MREGPPPLVLVIVLPEAQEFFWAILGMCEEFFWAILGDVWGNNSVGYV